MNHRYFEPLIEGSLFSNNGHPIFVKALTYGSRVIRLLAGFTEQRDHLHQARCLVIAHQKKYVQSSHVRAFPIQYYAYFTSATRSVRISVTGQVLGIFEDIPANPSFGITTADGKKRNYEIVDKH